MKTHLHPVVSLCQRHFQAGYTGDFSKTISPLNRLLKSSIPVLGTVDQSFRAYLISLITIFISYVMSGQTKGGIEQYNYFNNSGISTLMPIAHLQTNTGWHGEVRYNYEESKTASFYAGKSFSGTGTSPHFSQNTTGMGSPQ